jgi:hypothetical protein
MTLVSASIDARFVDKPVARVAAAASNLVVGREPANLTPRFMVLPQADLGHDVSILITAEAAAGR